MRSNTAESEYPLLGWCGSRGLRMMDIARQEVDRIEAKPVEEIRGSLARKTDADLVIAIPEVSSGEA
jgi:hypothetical protein